LRVIEKGISGIFSQNEGELSTSKTGIPGGPGLRSDPKKVGNVSAAVPHLSGCRNRFGSQPGYGKYQNQAEEEAQSTIQKAKGHC